MQQVFCASSFATGSAQRQVLSQRQSAAAFQPSRGCPRVSNPPRHFATIRATATPVASQSPFAAVDSEAALFGILKAGASAGKVFINDILLDFYAHLVFHP